MHAFVAPFIRIDKFVPAGLSKRDSKDSFPTDDADEMSLQRVKDAIMWYS